MSPKPGATRAGSASPSECHSCEFGREISRYVQMVTDFHFWGAKSGKTRLWVFQHLMCLQTQQMSYLQTQDFRPVAPSDGGVAFWIPFSENMLQNHCTLQCLGAARGLGYHRYYRYYRYYWYYRPDRPEMQHGWQFGP